jgi:hypothetical protein
VRRTCDFCGDPHPIWTITGGDLIAVVASTDGGLVQNFGDRWATCAPCHQHILASRPDRLLDRAIHSLPAIDPTARSKIAELHGRFLAGLQPGRTLITTTAWPAGHVNARDLPKIRDRLVRFYRGPIVLPGRLTADRDHLTEPLQQGRLYWIDPIFTDLATSAARSLPGTTLHPDLLPAESGILAWATPIGDTAATTWSLHETTVHVVRYRSIGAGLDETTLQSLREDVGWIAPIAEHRLSLGAEINPGQEPGIAVVLATWLLMGQPAAEIPAVEIDKPTRNGTPALDEPFPTSASSGSATISLQPPPTPAIGRLSRTGPLPRSGSGSPATGATSPTDPAERCAVPFTSTRTCDPQGKPIKASTTVRIFGGTRPRRPNDDNPPTSS